MQGSKLGKPENLTLNAISGLAVLFRSKNYTYAQIAEKLNENHYLTCPNKQFDGKAIYRLK